MSQHPLNLTLRFLLELAALAAYGIWGWSAGQGRASLLFAILFPLAAMLLWATFRAPGDLPGTEPRIPVPGSGRLLLEGVLFAFAVWALVSLQHFALAVALAVAVVIHYLLSYDRVRKLLDR